MNINPRGGAISTVGVSWGNNAFLAVGRAGSAEGIQSATPGMGQDSTSRVFMFGVTQTPGRSCGFAASPLFPPPCGRNHGFVGGELTPPTWRRRRRKGSISSGGGFDSRGAASVLSKRRISMPNLMPNHEREAKQQKEGARIHEGCKSVDIVRPPSFLLKRKA